MPAGDMDSEYTIGINNRFIGIDNDLSDDPYEIIRAAQEKPKKDSEVKVKGNKKDAKALAKPKDKPVKTETALPSPTEGNRDQGDRPRGRGRGRGRGGERGRGRGGGRGGVQNQNLDGENQQAFVQRRACHKCGEEGHFIRNCPQAQSRTAPSHDGGFGAPSIGGFGAAPLTEGFGGSSDGGFGAPASGFGSGFGNDDEGRRGGRGGFRGGRGRGRGGRGRGGSREFDRRSGSDKSSVKAFEKRDGSGSYNWGTPQDELDASEEQPQAGFGAPKDNEPVAETQETPEGGTLSAEENDKENAEPEQISFEEWKRKEEETRSKIQYNLRKANEGERIKGVKQLKKLTEEENEEDGSLFFPKKYYEEKLKTSGRVKEHMNLEFQFTSGENRHMDQGRRGGRGRGRGGRGGRGRDDYGGGFGSSAKIQLENAEEFPSLG